MRPHGARLLNVRVTEESGAEITTATVYLPEREHQRFLKKIRQYAEEDSKSGKPKNYRLLNSIDEISLAVAESFWVDPLSLFPSAAPVWCEVWLRTGPTLDDAKATAAEFALLCQQLRITVRAGFVVFPERVVVLVLANAELLARLVESSESIAEFRLAKETARFWVDQSPRDQVDWVQDLLARLTVDSNTKVAVTLLDTGVNSGHALLSQSIAAQDMHAFEPGWGTHDDQGHGTQMAGLAVYGDLQSHLEHSDLVEIRHKLESVKILPPSGANDPDHWGFITQQAVSRVEIANPRIVHIGCMAVTAPLETDHGRPSSWSAAIDAITSGCADDGPPRLFVVSAGNVREESDFLAYPDSNVTKSVENPGQAWNALTVGAYTEKARITDPLYGGHVALAPAGGLSPYSTTSLMWDPRKWPYKPDIILEGGNRGRQPGQGAHTSNYDDLSLLTTHYRPTQNQFDAMAGTSPATAKAAWMAAQIQTAYANAWPETIRGLMIHTAQWPEQLIRQFGINTDTKDGIARLMRLCGYGVPDMQRAIACASNSLTLIAQEIIQPFDKGGSGAYRTRDMHVHELPWPREVLLSLADTPVKLRITLSYFIEPGPGEVGWRDRYRYASHALRFDLNTPNESRQQFLHRLNAQARSDDEGITLADAGSGRWVIGKNGRTLGSVHSDTLEDTAANIATCNLVGVYPAVGWWRERHHLGRWGRQTRYSLIISLETQRQDVDIYTPVLNQVSVTIPT